jgi:ATP-dependent DNA helicase RecG
MAAAQSQNGSPPPEFEFDEDYSDFMVRLPVHPARAASAAVAKAIGEVGTDSALSRHQVEILRTGQSHCMPRGYLNGHADSP